MKRWPLFLIAMPAGVAVWSGWVGLGAMCGFGIIHPLPGIASGFTINTAITLPIGVEAYASYALAAWLSGARVAKRAKQFAKRSSIASLALGMLGQVAYHILNAEHASHAPWPVTVGVSCLPVISLGFGVALAHLLTEAPESDSEALSATPNVLAQGSEVIASEEPTAPPRPRSSWNINHMRARAQLDANPGLKPKEFAEQIGVTERHARRIFQEVRDSA